jgi:nucleoside-diphosphate kinase
MGIESTLVLIKPDAVDAGIQFDIIARIKCAGLVVPSSYSTLADARTIDRHYASVFLNNGPMIAARIREFMTSGPLVAAKVDGEDAVRRMRALAGEKTEPIQCPKGTIRGDYSHDSYALATAQKRAIHNIIHSSDSVQAAYDELRIWFGND